MGPRALPKGFGCIEAHLYPKWQIPSQPSLSLPGDHFLFIEAHLYPISPEWLTQGPAIYKVIDQLN